MNGTERRYFAGGNTAHGKFSFLDSALHNMNKIYVLQGYPGTGKSTGLRLLADAMKDAGLEVELFHSPLNPDDLDAVILTRIKTAIVDGAACSMAAEDARIVTFDLRPAVDAQLLPDNTEETAAALQERSAKAYSKAYACFAEALRIHDEWESFYIGHMDFQKADEVAREMTEQLLGGQSLEKQSTVRHLFFGAATPLGARDHIQNLTGTLDTRIFIKGRAGSGKSTLLKRLAAQAEVQGYDVDVFHCGFDPGSLDMLIFPELKLAIFDSTAPHEYFPDRASDRVLDMYERVIQPGIDERYEAELNEIKSRYAHKMKEATSFLADAREIYSQIKALYIPAVDFAYIDRSTALLRDELKEAILQIH